MWLIRMAMRRPITILMVIIGMGLMSIIALQRMRMDIFPDLGTPVIYVAQPYGGMDPAQMEGYLVNYYEYHFLYINGIEHVESKSIQGVGLVKLFFHPDTNMSQAMAETVGYVNRARAFMPPGTVPPFIMRFDAGSVPVGYLVFSSDTRGVGEISDLALFRVRPMFATLPGVSAPPPFGGNQRTIVLHVDPDKLRQYRMSPDEVVKAVSKQNLIMPSGTVRVGDIAKMVPVNSVIPNVQGFNDLPIRIGSGANVYLRDLGYAEDTTDTLSGYALVNGRRSVYIPVTKRADASTLSVVSSVRDALPKFRDVVPGDIKVDFVFDQSTLVTTAIRSLATEGLLGALLTGLMVLLFLRNLKSALIVILNIPLALLSAIVALWASGQSINLMTLGGLTLAIGILVDESTVAIENIHTHLASGKSRALAVFDASREVAIPQLLAMLCMLAVFAPSFFLIGVGRALFVPLALAVGFSMAASYFLARSFVPILSTWILRQTAHESGEPKGMFVRLRHGYERLSGVIVAARWIIVPVYLAACFAVLYFIFPRLGTEIFPQIDTGQLQVRIHAPIGTRVERTELIAQKVLDAIRDEAGGAKNIDTTVGYVGVQPSTYPIDSIYLWTSGPSEAVMMVALKPNSGVSTEAMKDKLRKKVAEIAPGSTVTFEAADLISQVMSFGAPTPIEVAVTGANLAASRTFATKLMGEFGKIPNIRDLQFGQMLDYPMIDVKIDRERAAQMGVTAEDVTRSLVDSTTSSRFVTPNYWADPNSGIAYQVQVEIPQSRMASIEDIQNIPVMQNASLRPLVGDVASVTERTGIGEYDRYNQQRMITITANVQGQDLGSASKQILAAIARTGKPPQGVTVNVRGQVTPMEQTLQGLRNGLGIAIIAIFILLAAYFQSMRIALVVIFTVPAVVAGVTVSLMLTHTTLNVQSFMGAILALGVAVANSILLATFAEHRRLHGEAVETAAVEGAESRLRPILMTSLSMIAGMTPVALGAAQTAPLGKAVIGGLIASTLTTLLILPAVFAIVQRRASVKSPSLDPRDPVSPMFVPETVTTPAAQQETFA